MKERAERLKENATGLLLNRIAFGDQQAFEELCRNYRGRMFRHAFNILGNAETADEVVQDALLGIWNGAKSFQGHSKPFTWMWAIVRNKTLGALRSRLRSAEVTANEVYEDVSIADPELDAIVGQALEKLSPEHRLAVILTYYMNLSQAQISALMHCPMGTVKSRLSTAVRHLREHWDTGIIRQAEPAPTAQECRMAARRRLCICPR